MAGKRKKWEGDWAGGIERREERESFALQQPSTNQIEAMAVWGSVLGEVSLLPP